MEEAILQDLKQNLEIKEKTEEIKQVNQEQVAAELFQLDLIAILNQMHYLLHGLAEMEELVWD